MSMEKRVQVGVKLPPELVSKLDAVRKSIKINITRTAMVEFAIDRLLDGIESGEIKTYEPEKGKP